MNQWLVRLAPRPAARVRLVCFPHAGGGAAAFAGWPSRLPDGIEVVAVRLPGRESRLREPPIAKWPTLIDALGDALGDLLEQPFVLVGHSLGAMIAYELTCRLAGNGNRPVGLVLAGCRAPHESCRVPAIHDLPDTDFLAGVRNLAGTPSLVVSDPRIMELVAPMLRADMALAETWPPSTPGQVPVPLATIAGDDDPMAPPDTVAAWARYAPAGFTTDRLPGGHFFVSSALPVFLDILRRRLDEWCPET